MTKPGRFLTILLSVAAILNFYITTEEKKWKEFLFIYGLYVSDKKQSFKIIMNMTQN